MSTIRAERLKVEGVAGHRVLGGQSPRMEWIPEAVDPVARGLGQAAWQVQVAADEGFVRLRWDSGRVPGSESFADYAGPALASRDACWWRVRLWDAAAGAPSPWSEASTWEVGLLAASDWEARWVSAPGALSMERLRWVWCADEPSAHQSAHAGTVQFKRVHSLPSDHSPVVAASALLLADDSAVLRVNGHEVYRSGSSTDDWRAVPRFALTHLRPFRNRFGLSVTNASEGSTAGVSGKILLQHADGSETVLVIDETWKSRRSSGRWQKSSILSFSTARGAASAALEPWQNPERSDNRILVPPAVFRRSFDLAEVPRHARIHLAARGIAEVHLNGARVSEDYFVPGWPDYQKRQFVATYPVEHLLRAGKNAIEITLAEGWFSGYVAWGSRRDHYGAEKGVLLQLEADGLPLLWTDGRWAVATDGPLRYADTLVGEYHDARREPTEWQLAALSNVRPVPLEQYAAQPVRITERLAARTLHEAAPGVWIFDLGQNMVGVVGLRVRGPRGTTIRVRHAEILQNDGHLYTEALRDAPCTDFYIKGSDGEESWHPRFTFHGFRYVELTGLAEAPRLDDVAGLVLHSDFPTAGDFSCSSEMVNRLQQNIVWSSRGNSLEIPTDCPQRDERLGWTGDAQIFIRTSLMNHDASAFWRRWLQALFDAQNAEGWFPYTAPTLPILNPGDICAAGWADAAIVCPWALFRATGDTRHLATYWDPMERYMAYLESSSEGLIRPDKGFGDWLSLNAQTPVDLMSTAFFAWNATLMAEMASALGLDERVAHFQNLFERIRSAYQRAFVGSDVLIKGNTQTAYVHALAWDLLPEGSRPRAVARLVQDIEYRGLHFSTGFMGLRDLLPVLSRFGRKDVAHKLLLSEEFPSWGYEIRCGATTIWERWDGWNADLGLQTAEMNSFNHYSLGAVGDWLFRNLGGISELLPGFGRICIAPEFSPSIPRVRVRHESARGTITSESWRDGGELHLRCRVPVGVHAEISLPSADPSRIREGSTPLSQTPLVEDLRTHDRETRFAVPSGLWHFAWKE
jgi:alpha-L-rhamnosidase